MTGKRVLLGVTGGIAAYKSPEMVRLLRSDGAEVRVVISGSGTDFVTPTTMQALSGQAVFYPGQKPTADDGMHHISLARWCDAVIVCPATANSLARFAHGLADDLLTSTILATASPVMVAPAMNSYMWLHPATQANVALLKSRKVIISGPDMGEQACGEHGYGRMLEPVELLQRVRDMFRNGVLQGKRIMVTAGATREPIDPVRYMSNRSSGLMGYCVAAAANEAGADVLLISGESTQDAPARVKLQRVTTAAEMRRTVLENINQQDIYVGAAAVSDYSCTTPSVDKIKRAGQNHLILELQANPDIIAELGAMHRRPFLVGFAAETGADLIALAKQKLQHKKIDMVVANKVGVNTGFGDVENDLLVVWANGYVNIARNTKQKLAHELVPIIANRYQHREVAHADKNT